MGKRRTGRVARILLLIHAEPAILPLKRQRISRRYPVPRAVRLRAGLHRQGCHTLRGHEAGRSFNLC